MKDKDKTKKQLLEELAAIRGRVDELERSANQQRATEEALRMSEERFRSLVERTSDWLWETNGKGVFSYVSPKIKELLGYTPEEVFGKSPLDLMPAKEAEGLAAVVYSHAKNRAAFVRLENWNRHKDGHMVLLETNGVPLFDDHGVWCGFRGIDRDITDRKKMEEALWESELKFRALFENADDAIFLMRENVFVDCNPKTLQMFQCAREQILGRSIYQFSPMLQPDGQDSKRKALERMRATMEGKPQVFEWKHCRYDGSPFDADVSLNRIELGGETLLQAIVRDVTARKQSEVELKKHRDHLEELVEERTAELKVINRQLKREIADHRQTEEALRESEKLYRDLADSLPQIVAEMDEKGNLTFVNRNALTLSGFVREDIDRGVNVLQMVIPEDRARLGRNITRVIQGETLAGNEYAVVRKDGSTFPVVAYTNPVVRHGRVIGYRAILVDITERKRAEEALKESEERYRSIFESSPLGIFQSTFDGRFIKVNPALANMLGHESPEDVIDSISDMAAQIYVRPKERREVLTRMLESDGQITYENDYLRKDGQRWIGHLTMSVIRDAEGRPHHLDGIVEDVTEKKEMEEKLQQTMENLRVLSRRLLEIQEAERRYIARELHDEMGQTLTALRISLKRAERPKTIQSTIATIHESVQMVDGLIKQVRSLSIELRPSILDDFGLTAALDWYTNWVSAKGGFKTAFHTELTEERLSPLLELTCFRIAQEALTNVVRHAKAQHVNVDLSTRNGELCLTVRDDGNGFPVDKIYKRALKGKTFGLLGMEERAFLAGGHLEYKSQPGHGTVVVARFPIKAVDSR
jgi:PAS domain S-box-containing protein